jgi:hypothetical protein
MFGWLEINCLVDGALHHAIRCNRTAYAQSGEKCARKSLAQDFHRFGAQSITHRFLQSHTRPLPSLTLTCNGKSYMKLPFPFPVIFEQTWDVEKVELLGRPHSSP